MPNQTPSSDAPKQVRDHHAGRDLYADEQVVWQGQPSILGTARHVLRVDLILVYFAIILTIGIARAIRAEIPWSAALWPLLPASIVFGLALLFARGIARSTRYIVTSRRIVIRYGTAMPRSLSLPFSQITSLALRLRSRSAGDIALAVRGWPGVSWPKLWPHVHGWSRPHLQPSLRNIPDAALVATRVSRLLAEAEQRRRSDKAADTSDFRTAA